MLPGSRLRSAGASALPEADLDEYGDCRGWRFHRNSKIRARNAISVDAG